MSQTQATRTVTVSNPEGLHLRAASAVAKLLGGVAARVELIKGNHRVDGTDVLQMISLCALPGDRLELVASGPDACDALDALVDLFDRKFADDLATEQDSAPSTRQRTGE